MAYCTVCGNEVSDAAAICLKCGCPVNGANEKKLVAKNEDLKKLQTSMILGIIGIVVAWVFALVGHVVSIIGIIFGVREYKETEIMTGLILSIIGEACSIVSSLVGLFIVSGIY